MAVKLGMYDSVSLIQLFKKKRKRIIQLAGIFFVYLRFFSLLNFFHVPIHFYNFRFGAVILSGSISLVHIIGNEIARNWLTWSLASN